MANKIKIKTESGEIEVDRDVIEAALKEADRPKVWKPEKGQKYFFLDRAGDVISSSWVGHSYDRDRFARGVFPTREAAEEDKRSGLDAYCVAYTTVKNWLIKGDSLGEDWVVFFGNGKLTSWDLSDTSLYNGFPFRLVSEEATKELIEALPAECKQLLWVKDSNTGEGK